jgi:hypothetical protein
LDRSLGKTGSITINNSHDGYVINNIALAWSSADRCYDEENTTRNIRYYQNICFGSFDTSSMSDPSRVFYADPLFVRPPYFHPKARAQYAEALAPSLLGKDLMLQPTSPALHKGIDPAALPNLPEAIVRDLKEHVHNDTNGARRPPGGRFDLGAYQSGPSS